jgi:hypothetical protein
MTTAKQTLHRRVRGLSALADHVSADHRFYAMIVYRLSLAVLGTIVVLTLAGK